VNETQTPPPPREVPAHELSATRLFAIVAVFLVLTAYAVWRSDRFQSMIHGVSQARLQEALGRPVTFRTVEIRFFPPSVRLADVRIGNDTRLAGPFLAAEEVSIGGGVSLAGNELRIGRIRALRPHVSLEQFPDGSWNLPPGPSGPSRGGGVKLHIASVLIQEGLLELQGKKIGIDGSLEGFTAELSSLPFDRYQGALDANRATLKIGNAEPLTARLSTRFFLNPARGVAVQNLSLSGSFGRLSASGAIETAGRGVILTASGDVSIDEVERIFHSNLGFSGGARIEARITAPKTGGFRLAASLKAPRVEGGGLFTFENVAASVTARPENLTAQIERADYAGGRATGVFRIQNLSGKPQPMTLAIEASGLSIERFFNDIGLKGTGLSASADLSVALRWGEAGIERADGGGTLTLAAGPPSSIERGRFGIPVSGGGPLAVVAGRIGFEGVSLHFPQSSLDLTGGLKLGVWQPDFDLVLRSKDLTEVDHLFQNFLAASGEKAEPLGLGGNGQAQGHLAGKWSDPDASLEISAEDARFSGVPFGSVHGSVDIREGAFWFKPLRVAEGTAGLTLEGMARFKKVPGEAVFDLAASARGYPLARLFQYLEFDFPITGSVTGDVRVAGAPPDVLTGGGAIELTDAVVYGQRFPRVTGDVRFEPGRFALGGVRASLDGTAIRGDGMLTLKEPKTFEAHLSGEAVPLEALSTLGPITKDVTGKLTFDLNVGGSLDRPDARFTGSLAHAVFYGRALPENLDPKISLTMTHGLLEASAGVPEHWTLKARGDVFGAPAKAASNGSDLRPYVSLSGVLARSVFHGASPREAPDSRLLAAPARVPLPAASVPASSPRSAPSDLPGHLPGIDIALDAPDLGSLLALTPLAPPEGAGGSLALNGSVTLPAREGELPSGSFTITRARLDLPGHPGILTARSPVQLALVQGRLTVQEFEAAGDGTALKLGGSVSLAAKPLNFAASLSGTMDASLLAVASPDLNPSGRIVADLKASGTFDAPQLAGSVRLEDARYRVTSLAQILDNIEATITFRGSRGELDARARTGGGDLFASGSFALKGLTPGDFRLTLGARRVALRYPRDLRLIVDADLVASNLNGAGSVRGEVVLQRGTYSKDIQLTISDLLASSRPEGVPIAQEAWKERTSLEIRVVSTASLELRNNLARLTASVDLFVRGTVADPTLVGQIVLDEGGRITFRDVRYEVDSGVIAFANTAGFSPIIDLRLRAEVKGYDIGVGLVGTWPRIQTSFTSDPPLPEESIVGLLIAGTEPTTSGAGGGTLAATAGNIVGGAATGVVTRPTQRLFRLDRFEIDPIFSGSGPVDVRSTVGKQITPNLGVTYSQSFDTSHEPIFRVEWWLSDSVVLQGRRDENGIYLIDVRRRQRL
jgi:uncharacterized protein involved in outer membrane biogenesis